MTIAGNSPGFVGDVTCIVELPVAATTKPPYNTIPLPYFCIRKCFKIAQKNVSLIHTKLKHELIFKEKE